MLAEVFTTNGISALLEVIGINLVLSGDNPIVIGMAAAGLPAQQRGKVILFGVMAATVLRLIFAVVAVRLLAIPGLLLAGGLVLLWVCWNMWGDLRGGHDEDDAADGSAGPHMHADGTSADHAPTKTFRQAAFQIVVADVSMSLDNVLAVAGAAGKNMLILSFGLVLSIALMGLAANLIARLLDRYRWIAYVGLAIILYVALDMIWEGWHQLLPLVMGA